MSSALAGNLRRERDHDRETNALRGLLCNRCNSGIGMLADSSPLLFAAAAYLKRWGK